MSSKGSETFERPNDSEKGIAQENITVGPISEQDHHDLIQTLRETVSDHELDPNFPVDILNRARKFIDEDFASIDADQARKLVLEIESERELLLNDSPYAEVRSVVEPTDDPSTPVNTVRAWFLGMFFVILGTGLDQFFSLRQPGIYVSAFVAQLVCYPIGVAMARYLPTKTIPLGRFSFSLNPGPFNQKEHMLITIMSNVSYGGLNGTAYVTYIFQVLKLDLFYGEKTLANSAGFQILLVLSTQLIGYGCAGLTRRFLVYPPTMIWPRNLAQIALNKALHHDNGRSEAHGWRITRFKFFIYTFCAMFFYFWFPDYLFQAMSYFNWITWISPNNVKLAIITGSFCGLGLNPWPTFDWNILYVDPIITPWFAMVNLGIGMAIAGFFIGPILYFNNVFNTGYLPINSNYVFDNTGSLYNISRILNSDFTVNDELFEAYSLPYLSAMNGLLYSAFFAVYTATISYVALYHWKDLKSGFTSMWKWRNAREEHTDVHNRLMKAYKEAPEWWYLVVLALSFVLACIACRVYDTGMPVWGIIFAIGLCLLLQIPIGVIQAVTNIEVTNNVIAEFVGGYALPGKPIANMIFKSYGYIATAQSIQFTADLKLGHYMKIPPRTMFWAQTLATIVGALVSIGVNDFQLSSIEHICEPGQKDKFTCPGSHTFFTASVIWGAIGPKRLFGKGGQYNGYEYGFLAGLLAPLPFYLLSKKFPDSISRYIHVPLLLVGMLFWAPYNFSYMWPAIMAGFFFNYYIKRRYVSWWQKYAFVLTSSFSVAIAISAIIIFFAVQFKAKNVDWWGNNISYEGVDAGASENACVYLPIPDVGYF